MNSLYNIDLPRYEGSKKNRVTKFLYWLRVAQESSNSISKSFGRMMKKYYGDK